LPSADDLICHAGYGAADRLASSERKFDDETPDHALAEIDPRPAAHGPVVVRVVGPAATLVLRIHIDVLAPTVADLKLVPVGKTLLRFYFQPVVIGIAAGIEVVAAGKSRIRPALLYRTRIAGRDRCEIGRLIFPFQMVRLI